MSNTVTTLTLTNLSGQSGKVTTIGHGFQQGDVGANQFLAGSVNGVNVGIQMDVKATWPDGSVKHALLSFTNPNAADGSVMQLSTSTQGATGSALDVATVANAQNYNFSVHITHEGQTHTVNVHNLLNAQQGEDWINGPLASETRVTARPVDDLDLKFDVRAKADGSIETQVTAARHDLDPTNSADNMPYTVQIVQNGQTLFSDTLDHWRYSNWHETYNFNSPSDLHVNPDSG